MECEICQNDTEPDPLPFSWLGGIDVFNPVSLGRLDLKIFRGKKRISAKLVYSWDILSLVAPMPPPPPPPIRFGSPNESSPPIETAEQGLEINEKN